MATVGTSSTPATVSDELVASYRENGFVRVRNVLTDDEVSRFLEAAEKRHDRETGLAGTGAMFRQIIQVWERDEVLRQLTLHTDLASIATRLAGVPLRLWHDQLLVKAPHNGARTEYHQDAPYWPHRQSRHSLSAWIALVDVPVERGCMSFIPGQQARHELRATDIGDSSDLFRAAPDLTWAERVTIPLRAGDVTFHNGYTPHTANANDTDEYRWAHVNIYVDRDVQFSGGSHPVTDPLGLREGDRLPDDHFPLLPR